MQSQDGAGLTGQRIDAAICDARHVQVHRGRRAIDQVVARSCGLAGRRAQRPVHSDIARPVQGDERCQWPGRNIPRHARPRDYSLTGRASVQECCTPRSAAGGA